MKKIDNFGIKHIWTILCSNSSIDQNTNNVSLFNVIEQVELQTIDKKKIDKKMEKGIPLNSELISLWNRKSSSKKDYQEKVEFIDPTGKVLNTIETPLKIPDNIQSFRMTFKIMGLKVTTAGEYCFKISAREDKKDDFVEVASLPLRVVIK